MKRLVTALLFFLLTELLAARAEALEGLTLRLVAKSGTQLVGDAADLRLLLANEGATSAYVDRGFLDLHIEVEMMDVWVTCGQMHRGTPGVRTEAQWQRIDPGAELLIGLKGGYWCPEDAGPVYSGRDWREVPGDYKLRVDVSHVILPHELERVGPAPDGARDWTLRSNVVEISVKDPVGIDAEALRWARQQKDSPVSIEVANKFPESRYAALLIGRRMTIGDAQPEYVKGLIEKGGYPPLDSVPDPSFPNGWRSINTAEEMARWLIDQGESLLRNQQGFPYERDVRLAVALSYAAIGNKEKSTELLNAIKSEKGTPEGQWAARFLALQGW